MRKYLTFLVCLVLIVTLFSMPALGAKRKSSKGGNSTLAARIQELEALANQRLARIQQLEGDVAFRDGIIADLRTRITGSSTTTGLIIISSVNSKSDSYYKVTGEVQNNTNNVINFPKIVATFYDVNGVIVATDFTYASITPLQVGQKSPFEISVSNYSSDINRIIRYELQTNY
jgi:hypothetical protein